MHWAKWKSEVANTMKLPREAGQSCFKHVPLVGVRSLNSLKMEWRDLWGKTFIHPLSYIEDFVYIIQNYRVIEFGLFGRLC